MMRQFFAGLLACSLLWTGARGNEETPDSLRYTFYDSVYAHELPADTFVHAEPGFVGFGEGERLVFAMHYGLISAGDATLEIRNIAIIDGMPCYRIVSDARTNDFFSTFFKVRDRYESYMDTTELYSHSQPIKVTVRKEFTEICERPLMAVASTGRCNTLVSW